MRSEALLDLLVVEIKLSSIKIESREGYDPNCFNIVEWRCLCRDQH